MTTRKELLGNLMSKGIVVTNPLFENEDLEHLDNEVTDILETITFDAEGETEDDTEDPVAEQKLNGKSSETTDVVHVLYPGVDFYPDLMSWAERIKEEYEDVDLKYFDEMDTFVFFSGSEDEAMSIAHDIISEIE